MKQLLTLRELAEETGLSIATLRDLCQPHGDLPVVRPTHKKDTRTRGRIYVTREDWLAWVAKHRSTPAPAIEASVTRKSISDLPGADRYAD